MTVEEMYQALCRPQDEESLVCAVLDGLLQGDGAAHSALLSVPESAFTSHRAGAVWGAMGRIYRSGSAPNIPAISRDLSRNGAPVERADLFWLDDQHWGDISDLADTVLSLHQRRELFKLFRQSSADVLSVLLDHRETAQSTASKSLSLTMAGADPDHNAWDTMAGWLETGHRFSDSDRGGKLAWFGLPTLDGSPEDGGIPAAPGHVVIVAARPGIGKTALATQIIGASSQHGEKVFMISLELSRDEMLQRLAGWYADTRRGIFSAGTYTEYQSGRLRAQKDAVQLVQVWDPAGPTWSRIESKIRGAAMKGFRVVVIDHFSEIDFRPMIPKGGKRSEGSQEVAKRMKSLAKELNICIVLLAQINREVPPGEVPGTEHLRETGELEQVAYSILVLYYEARPAGTGTRRTLGPDAPPPEPKPAMRMALVKNRDGRSGFTRRISFDGASCRMVEHEN